MWAMKVDRLLNLMLHRRQYLRLPLGTGAGASPTGGLHTLVRMRRGAGTASGDAAGGGRAGAAGRRLLQVRPLRPSRGAAWQGVRLRAGSD